VLIDNASAQWLGARQIEELLIYRNKTTPW
jgi:hypothetical protein